MAKIFIVVLAAALIVATLATEFADDFENDAFDVEFLKRDPELQEYLMAEKRGRNIRKYKQCTGQMFANQNCWCMRRTNRLVFCNGAGTGDAVAGVL